MQMHGTVKDGDDHGRSALRTERVRHHRRELGRLAGLHPDGSLAEQDQDGPGQDGKPGVHGGARPAASTL